MTASDPWQGKAKSNMRRDRLLIWFGIGITVVAGIALVALPGSSLLPNTSGFAGIFNLLTNIGYGLIGGGITAGVFQIATGNTATNQQEQLDASLQSLQEAINKVPGIVETATTDQEKHFIALSSLLRVANSMGLEAISPDRDSNFLENQMSFVDRWAYLLKHAKEVDLLCWQDTRLLARPLVDKKAEIVTRLHSGALKLRILLSTLDNESLPLVDAWIPNYPLTDTYMAPRVKDQAELLHAHIIPNDTSTDNSSEVLRRHNRLLAFTLLRGDDEMYILYFFPGRGTAGPILQFAKPKPLNAGGTSAGGPKDWFKAYGDYFESIWNEPILARRETTK